jgi:EmrB/QacA subfamily drug resistance transporter
MDPSVLVPLVVASALFMENMDSTVIATSLPAIALDLGVNAISLKLTFTSYLLSLAVFIPISGWCADRFGARTVFRIAIAVFTAGSIACAFSSSLTGFVIARAIQGMGGAMMVPVGRIVILRTVPKNDLVRALSYLTVPALIGPIIGPVVGGFITTYLHWRWIFWINFPVGILGIALATRYMPFSDELVRAPLDVTGFILSGSGLAMLIFGLTSVGRGATTTTVGLSLIGAGAVLMAIYTIHARRTEHPIIDLTLLKTPTFRTSIGGGFLFRTGIGAVPFLLPLLLQIGFGMTPFASGTLTFAAAAGAMLLKFAAAPILRFFGFRKILLFNALISAGFLAATALFTAQTNHLVILIILFVGGFFRSLQFTALNAVAYADIPAVKISAATSFSSVVQQVSGSVGVALAAIVLEASQWSRGANDLSVYDFDFAFLAIALISGSSALFHRLLPEEAGGEVSGHAPRSTLRTAVVSQAANRNPDKPREYG